METGIELIAQERHEQIEKHGRTVDLDATMNLAGQLTIAAEFLIQPGEYQRPNADEGILENIPYGWDDRIWLKMCYKNQKERLVIAGALIAAEIDRIQSVLDIKP